jgi:hypothetical protein
MVLAGDVGGEACGFLVHDRGRLGDESAITAAQLLATGIDNPALSSMLGNGSRWVNLPTR